MAIEQVFIDRLKKKGVSDEHVHAIEQLVDKLRPYFASEMKDSPKAWSYQFRHKLAQNNMIYNITEDGRLWIRREALEKFCPEKKIAALYDTMKQLTGWTSKSHTSTNPAVAINIWHDKVDAVVDALIKVLPQKDDDDDDLYEGEEV